MNETTIHGKALAGHQTSGAALFDNLLEQCPVNLAVKREDSENAEAAFEGQLRARPPKRPGGYETLMYALTPARSTAN